jgi:hypothetical protein
MKTTSLAYGTGTIGDRVTRAHGPLAYATTGTVIRIDALKGTRVKWDDGDETWIQNSRSLDTLEA